MGEDNNATVAHGRRMHTVSWLLAATVIALELGACVQRDDFLCGTRSLTDDNKVRVCDRAGEICVCTTSSCAHVNASCESGYAYVDEPFALHAYADKCVDSQALATAQRAGTANACEPSSGADAGIDAGSAVSNGGSP